MKKPSFVGAPFLAKHRYCDSSLFGGFEDIGSIKRVEIDLSNPTLMVYESSKFLGENLVTNIRRPIVYCATLIRYMYFNIRSFPMKR